MQSHRYATVKNLLKSGMDRVGAEPVAALPAHENIRGAQYYDDTRPDSSELSFEELMGLLVDAE